MDDDQLLEELFVQHEPFLRDMVARRLYRAGLPPRRWCDDIVGDVMAEVCKRWVARPGRPVRADEWKAYLTVIAHYRIFELIKTERDQRRIFGRLLHAVPKPRSYVEDPTERARDREILRAIEGLEEPDQSLLRLIVFDDLTPGKAATELDLDANVGRAAISRLSKKIKAVAEGGTVKGTKAAGIRRLAAVFDLRREGGDRG